MCDTFVALPAATAGKSVILGKNADCRVNEAHALLRLPRRQYSPGELLRATHIMIPQAEETYDTILSRSFWTWGGEIGLNEYGVAIGNEAVFTTVMNDEKEDGLITMDLLRLGLERAKTAREAVEVMGEMVHRFGQGGNCEVPGNSHWDSSYLISDAAEAWILETAGREWAAKKANKVDSISNAFVIQDDWDLSSLSDSRPDLNWDAEFGDHSPVVEEIGSLVRQRTTCDFLKNVGQNITIRDAFNLLRSHPEGYHPATAHEHAICMHAGPGEGRLWNACGAMASEVGANGAIGWFTGTSGTCVSIFKPVFPGIDLPNMGAYPIETFNPGAMWWIGELLQRRAMADFDNAVPAIRSEFEALEDRFIVESQSVIKGTSSEKKEFMADCFQRASEATSRWMYRLAGRTDLHFEDKRFGEAWQQYNREAGLTGMPS
jgi:secernin